MRVDKPEGERRAQKQAWRSKVAEGALRCKVSACLQACMYTPTHACEYACVMHMCACLHIGMCTCVSTRVYIQVCVCVRTHIHALGQV